MTNTTEMLPTVLLLAVFLVVLLAVALVLVMRQYHRTNSRKSSADLKPPGPEKAMEGGSSTVLLQGAGKKTDLLNREGAKTIVLIPDGIYARKMEHVCTSQLTMGRNTDCDICIPDDTSVSGVHCIFFYNRRGELSVRDNHSSNGTYLNETKLSEMQPLRTGDILEVGRVRYQVQLKQ